LEVVKFLKHGWNLMRGCKGSMWAYLCGIDGLG
jgi:hypothetical protein